MSLPLADNLEVWHDATPTPNGIANHSGAESRAGWDAGSYTVGSGVGGTSPVGGYTLPTARNKPIPASGSLYLRSAYGTASGTWELRSPTVAVRAGDYRSWSVFVGLEYASTTAVVLGAYLETLNTDGGTTSTTGPITVTIPAGASGMFRVGSAGSLGSGQIPANTVAVRVRITAPTPPAVGASIIAARAVVKTSPFLADVSTIPDLAEPAWTKITSTLTGARIRRGGDLDGVTDDIETGTATLTFLGSAVDPATNAAIRRGRLIEITSPASNGDQPVIFRGVISSAVGDYSDGAGTAPARVTITAQDAVGILSGVPEPAAYVVPAFPSDYPRRVVQILKRSGALALPAIMADGLGSYAEIGRVIGHVDNASTWRQIMLAANGVANAKAAVDRTGRLWFSTTTDVRGGRFVFSAEPGAAQSFSDLELEYGTSTVVNSLTVTRTNDAELDGEKTYGPYRNEYSVAQWGAVSAELQITDGDPAALAGAYLRRYASPVALPRRLTFPVRTGDELARLIDVYDTARVVLPSRNLDVTLWVIGVEHAITAAGWTVTLTLRPLDTVTSGDTISNPPGGAATGPGDYAHTNGGPLASRYRGTGQSIPTGAWTDLVHTSYVTQDSLTHNATTGEQTAQVAGRYLVAAGVEFAGNATGLRGLRLTDSGTVIGTTMSPAGAATATLGLTITKAVTLAVGDTIGAEAYQTSGAALTTIGSTVTRSVYLDVTYLGE